MQGQQELPAIDRGETVVDFSEIGSHRPIRGKALSSGSELHDLTGVAIDVDKAAVCENALILFPVVVVESPKVLRVFLFDLVGEYVHWPATKIAPAFPF